MLRELYARSRSFKKAWKENEEKENEEKAESSGGKDPTGTTGNVLQKGTGPTEQTQRMFSMLRGLAELKLEGGPPDMTPFLHQLEEETLGCVDHRGFPDVRLALCVHTYKRSWQLKATLPCMLCSTWQLKPYVRIYVADYNDDSNLSNWARTCFPESLVDKSLIWLRLHEPKRIDSYHCNLAKNGAHYFAAEDSWRPTHLVNVDNDRVFTAELLLLLLHQFSSDDMQWIHAASTSRPGTDGTIAVATEAFIHSGGYDEEMGPSGYGDYDFLARLKLLAIAGGKTGMKTPKNVDVGFTVCNLEPGVDLEDAQNVRVKTKNMDTRDGSGKARRWGKMDQDNKAMSLRKIQAGELRANQKKDWNPFELVKIKPGTKVVGPSFRVEEPASRAGSLPPQGAIPAKKAPAKPRVQSVPPVKTTAAEAILKKAAEVKKIQETTTSKAVGTPSFKDVLSAPAKARPKVPPPGVPPPPASSIGASIRKAAGCSFHILGGGFERMAEEFPQQRALWKAANEHPYQLHLVKKALIASGFDADLIVCSMDLSDKHPTCKGHLGNHPDIMSAVMADALEDVRRRILFKPLANEIRKFANNDRHRFTVYIYCKQNRHRSVALSTLLYRGMKVLCGEWVLPIRVMRPRHLCQQSQSEVRCQRQRTPCEMCGSQNASSDAALMKFVSELRASWCQ